LRVLAGVAVAIALALGASIHAAAAPPAVGAHAANLVGQDAFGTIKGRLVWGGNEVPKPVVLEPMGKAAKDPNVCAKSRSILSREIVVHPKTKGIAYAFAYLARPKGENELRVPAVCPGDA
jgi:hypothetical protein